MHPAVLQRRETSGTRYTRLHFSGEAHGDRRPPLQRAIANAARAASAIARQKKVRPPSPTMR